MAKYQAQKNMYRSDGVSNEREREGLSDEIRGKLGKTRASQEDGTMTILNTLERLNKKQKSKKYLMDLASGRCWQHFRKSNFCEWRD